MTPAHATPSTAPAESTERALGALVQLLASVEAVEIARWGDLGVTISQLRVLHQLREHPASCGQVAEHLGITASTATALIDRLVRRGLIQRGPRLGDRRVTELSLASAAQELLEAAARRKGGEMRAAVEELPPSDRKRLAELLDRLADHVQSADSGMAVAADLAPAATEGVTPVTARTGVGA